MRISAYWHAPASVLNLLGVFEHAPRLTDLSRRLQRAHFLKQLVAPLACFEVHRKDSFPGTVMSANVRRKAPDPPATRFP